VGNTSSRRAAACLTALALLIASLALALPARSDAADKGVVTDLTWGISAADQDRTAAAMKDVGATSVRLSMSWSDAEPQRGAYSAYWFAQYDRAVALSRANGAQVVFMVYQSPSWASGSSNPDTKPRDPADYANFVRYVAARYAGRVQAYEIWNEQNFSRFWPTGPNPAEYTSLLKAAYPAVKQSDPAATVLMGGLSANDYDYLQGMYDAGARPYFDGANVHPYTGANDPTLCWNQAGTARKARDAFCGYEEVYATMSRNGDAGKGLWMTEMGYSTTSAKYGVSKDRQAEYLVKAYRRLEQHPYVRAMFWYQLRNYSPGGANLGSWRANLGLLRTDYSKKPAYDALKGYTSAASAKAGLRRPERGTVARRGEAHLLVRQEPRPQRQRKRKRRPRHREGGVPHRRTDGGQRQLGSLRHDVVRLQEDGLRQPHRQCGCL